MVRDPVCGLMVGPEWAPAKSEYEGKTYYFCTRDCKVDFDEDPEKYVEGNAWGAMRRGVALRRGAAVRRGVTMRRGSCCH